MSPCVHLQNGMSWLTDKETVTLAGLKTSNACKAMQISVTHPQQELC